MVRLKWSAVGAAVLVLALIFGTVFAFGIFIWIDIVLGIAYVIYRTGGFAALGDAFKR